MDNDLINTGNDKSSVRKIGGVKIFAIVVTCIIIIILVVSLPLIFIQNEINTPISSPRICGVGYCYLIDLPTFQGHRTEHGYEEIISVIVLLKSSGVGAIIVSNINSNELSGPINSMKLKKLIVAASKYQIKVYYNIGDLGSVNSNHPWASDSRLFAKNRINDRRIFDYNNKIVFTRVQDVINEYLKVHVNGIYVLGLPREIIDGIADGTVNTNAIMSLKSIFNHEDNKLVIIASSSPYISYKNTWKGQGIDGLINTEISAILKGTISPIDFIYENIVKNKMFTPPLGPVLIWAYSSSGFSTIDDKIRMAHTPEYIAIISFMMFLPGEIMLNNGDEFDITLKSPYKDLRPSLNEYNTEIWDSITKLSDIKTFYLSDSNNTEIRCVPYIKNLILCNANIKEGLDLRMYWNRSGRPQDIDLVPILNMATVSILFNYPDTKIPESNIVFEVGGILIIKTES